jgi:hypothetical protein
MTLLEMLSLKFIKPHRQKVTVQLFYENLTQEILASSTLKSQSERKNDYKTNIDK